MGGTLLKYGISYILNERIRDVCSYKFDKNTDQKIVYMCAKFKLPTLLLAFIKIRVSIKKIIYKLK